MSMREGIVRDATRPLPAQMSSSSRSRSSTPPRSASHPVRLLRICLDDRVLGAVEVNEASTLVDVRQMIVEDEILGVPACYLFVFGGAPVSKRQEGRRRAVDCFPFLAVIPEDARIAGPAGGSEAVDAAAAAVVVVASSQGSGGGGEGEPASGDSVAPPTATVRASTATASSAAIPSAAPVPPATPSTSSDAVARRLELQITDGPLEGTTVTVGEEGARVGRHTSNALVIPEAGISRYHCEICHIGGEFCVRDLGSTTGTFFYLKPHAHFRMFVGLMVKLGETEFQVATQQLLGESEPEQVVLFYEGPLAGHKVHIPSTGITIGRRHNNHLVLVEDGTVSAHHALIFSEGSEFFITDLGSCNGTCVRLSTERTDSDWHPIMDSDIIGAGCTKIRCRVFQ